MSQLPTAPTPAAPATTLARLTVTPAGGGSIVEGLAIPITSSGGIPSTGPLVGAFAQYTDGSSKYIEAAWTSSNPQVLAIEGGAFVAKARGTAVVTASAEGKTASETFKVEPGIAGNWSGTYTVQQCEAGSGSIGEVICFPLDRGRTPGLLAAGVVAPMTLQITKSGNDLSAAAQFGNLRGTLTGTERATNTFALTGALAANATTMTVVFWDARVRDDVMEGSFVVEVRIAGLPSHAQVAGRIDNVTRR